MSLLNRTAFLRNLIIGKLLNKNIPLTVIFNVTDRCNLRCSYCYVAYYQRKKDELPLDRILAIIDELSEMGCKRVSFGGGEPLLREDIGEMIDYVKERRMECVINSNGYLVAEKIDILKNIDVLCLSLDGNGMDNDIYRGKGSFKKVVEAIECASRYKIPIHTNTVLHRNNLHSIEFVLDVAKKYNLLAEFNLAIAYLLGENKNADYKSADPETKEALLKLIRYKKEGYNILFSKKAFEYTLLWPTYSIEAFFDNSPDFTHANCYAGRYFCIVDTNGDVYPCPHLIDRIKPINVTREGFKRAFANLDKHNCKACYQVYHNEFNLLFSLDYSVIYNHIKNSFKTSAFGRRHKIKDQMYVK